MVHDVSVDTLVPLSDLAAIQVSGSDALSFLQRQLCGDLRPLEPGQSLYSGWCNPQGRLICDLLVLRPELLPLPATDNTESSVALQATQAAVSCYLILHHSQVDTVIRGLRRYVLRDRVTLTAADFTVAGLDTRAVYASHAKIKNKGANAAFCAGSWQLPWDHQRKIILTVTTEVAVTAAETDPWQAAAAARRAEYQHWCSADIEQGVAWLPAALSAQFLPQMLAFEALGAVSYAKGCYPGQEVIARTHYLGQVKRHWSVLRMSALQPDPEVGAIIYNHKDEDVGVLLAIAKHGEDNLLLVVLHRDADRQSLHIQSGPHSTPLYSGESATCLNNSC